MAKIFFFFLSMGLTILFLEAFIQFSEIGSKSVSRNDPVLGSALKPNREMIKFTEGFYVGGTNEYAYLGPGYPKKVEQDVIRIALIGDSFVEGFQVFDRDHFRSILEKKLFSLGKKVEVLNFGMSGFNLNDDYCYFINFVKQFNPDISLFFVSNEDFNLQSTSNRRPKCYLANGKIKIDYSFNQTPAYKFREKTAWLRGKSVILGYIFKAQTLIKRGSWKKIIFDKFFVNNVNGGEEDAEYENPHLSQLHSALINSLLAEKGVYFVEKKPLNENIKNLFIKNSNRLLDLPVVEGKENYYWKITNKYGHWNPPAHRKIGNYLAQKMSNLGILQKK